jgi:hypothetical protein
MRAMLLPGWPIEVLVEWLHRHAGERSPYDFLDFPTLTFDRQTWPLDRIPGREAFGDPGLFDFYLDVEAYQRKGKNWLADYMCEHGTWNTPIVLLDNSLAKIAYPVETPLRSPYHLLEGHRRLSFLNGLRAIGKAGETHAVWLATKPT